MKKIPRTSSGPARAGTDGKEIVAQWDGMSFMDRLNLVKENYELFWALELVTRDEVAMLLAMPESAHEYIVSREEHPIFTSLDLKKDIEAQIHRAKLEAALGAVFK